MKIFERKEPLLIMENLSQKFDDKIILRDIGSTEPIVISNITRPNMQQGQTVAIVGPSGSGKTTLFKIIAGIIETPTTGRVTIPLNGNGVHTNVKVGDIGYVQQTYPLSRNENVYKMLSKAANQGCVKKNEQNDLIDNYLEIWGLKEQKFLGSKKLSGGQRQRVAIIEQLLCSHYFIIFDEPFSGLDVKNITDVKKSFFRITTTNEINTIIFSTHDIHLAVELADSIYVMGFEKNAEGKRIPGGTIIKKYDLKESGLAWDDSYTTAHNELAKEIIETIKLH